MFLSSKGQLVKSSDSVMYYTTAVSEKPAIYPDESIQTLVAAGIA